MSQESVVMTKAYYLVERIIAIEKNGNKMVKKAATVLKTQALQYAQQYSCWLFPQGDYTLEEIEKGRLCCEAKIDALDRLACDLCKVYGISAHLDKKHRFEGEIVDE